MSGKKWPYKCMVCGAKFRDEQKGTDHIEVEHQDEIENRMHDYWEEAIMDLLISVDQ